MVPYFQRMKLVSSSWLRPRTILDQTTTVTLSTPRVNQSLDHKKGLMTLHKSGQTLSSKFFSFVSNMEASMK